MQKIPSGGKMKEISRRGREGGKFIFQVRNTVQACYMYRIDQIKWFKDNQDDYRSIVNISAEF